MSLALPLISVLLTIGAVLTLFAPSRVSVRRHLEPYATTPQSTGRSSVAVSRRVYELAEAGISRLRIWFITSDARKGFRSTGKLCSSQRASSSGGRMVPVITITSMFGDDCRNSTPNSTPLPSGSM